MKAGVIGFQFTGHVFCTVNCSSLQPPCSISTAGWKSSGKAYPSPASLARGDSLSDSGSGLLPPHHVGEPPGAELCHLLSLAITPSAARVLQRCPAPCPSPYGHIFCKDTRGNQFSESVGPASLPYSSLYLVVCFNPLSSGQTTLSLTVTRKQARCDPPGCHLPIPERQVMLKMYVKPKFQVCE